MEKILWIKRRVSRIFFKKVLSRSATKILEEAFCVSKKNPVVKMFLHRRGGGITVLSEMICFILPKKCAWGYLCSRNVLVWNIILDKSEGITFFRRNFFVAQSRKISHGNSLCFERILVMKFFMHRRGNITVSSNFFCLTKPKNHSGVTLVFQRCSDMEKNTDKKGRGYQVLPSELFCLTVPKKIVGGPLRFRIVLVWEKGYG